jgi:hypothetical protein
VSEVLHLSKLLNSRLHVSDDFFVHGAGELDHSAGA